jgi:D-alanyl-D-alanine carboxypeptidase
MVRRLQTLPLLATLTMGCAPADPRVEHELQDVLERHDIPGAAVILRVGGEERFRLELGEADPESGVPMRTASRVRIGSITKTLTALTLAELAQRGALDLDDPVADWVPGVPWGDFMRVRHLLTHESGLRHYEDVPSYAKHQHDAWSEEAMLAAVAAEGPVAFPGERFHYSSTGYLVAGMVLEAAIGRPWQHGIRDVLHTQQHAPGISLAEAGAPLAVGHHDGPIGASHNADNGRAGAALVASADDLDTFFLALSRGDVVREETLAEASRPQVDRSEDLAYGLGLNVWPDQYGHRGRVLGYAAAWRHRTDEDAQLVLTLNASEVSSIEIEEEVWEMLEAYGYLD